MSIRSWLRTSPSRPPTPPTVVIPPGPPTRPRTSDEVSEAEKEAITALIDLMKKLSRVNLMPECATQIIAISDKLWSYRGRRYLTGDLKPTPDASKPHS